MEQNNIFFANMFHIGIKKGVVKNLTTPRLYEFLKNYFAF